MKTLLSISAAVLFAGALASPAAPYCDTTNNCVFPPGPCAYLGFETVTFTNGAVLNYLDFENSLNCDALPPVGGSTNQLITSTCVLRLANGGPPALYSGGAVMTVHLFGDPGVNPREFGLELLALDFPFFSLPAATKLRESPTLPSSGHATITEGPPGQYHIESFFDVFFELSTDSGQSWFPASGPLRTVLSPAAPLPARPATWGAVKATYR